MVIGAFLFPIVFIGTVEAAVSEAAPACARDLLALWSGVCAKLAQERIATAASAKTTCSGREAIPREKQRPSPKINLSSCLSLLRMSLRIPHSLRRRIPFLYRDEIIGGKIVQHVHIAARPTNFQSIHALVFPQPKKDSRILRRTITHPAFHLVVAPKIPCSQFKKRPIPVAIAFRSDQPHREPVISRRSRLARAIVAK